ncbi:hypothetical protein ACFC34_35890 [Streptomyces sp. NPDC056053]|uniref:hypothetical protein n=1 Tax=Streptomyces sp. NPDC056053 TaxID=3345696 RepID=UPI0035DB4EDA
MLRADFTNRLVGEVAAGIAPFEVVLSRPGIETVAIESKGYPDTPYRELWEMTWQAQWAVAGEWWLLSRPVVPAPGSRLRRSRRAVGGPQGVALSDLLGGPVTVPVTALTLVA